ncbi:MAG: M48 family metalloprotease [Tepidisphaeraceae bacterium]
MTTLKRFFAGLMCAVPLMLTVGCASDKAVIDQAEGMHGDLTPAIVTDQDLADYVQAVGDRVVHAAREAHEEGFLKKRIDSEDPSWMFDGSVKFHLVNSDTLNAFTTGGEHVYLYSELFQKAESEAEFAAVVAHEFGHIYGRHIHKSMNRQYTIIGAAVAAGGAGYLLGGDNKEELAGMLASGALVGGQLVGLKYGRGDEAEADDLGFHFYTLAGWDPAHFPDFFARMIKLGYETKGADEMMSDHPSLSSRVAKAQENARSLPPEASSWRQPDLVSQKRFNALRKRAEVVGKTMPNDQSLASAKLLLASFPSCVAPVDQQSQVKARQKVQAIAEQAARETGK